MLMCRWDTIRTHYTLYGINEKLIKGIKSFYAGSTASIRINCKLSNQFDINGGVWDSRV